METKSFKLKTNVFQLKKSNIEIGPDGISKNGELDRWSELTKMSCYVMDVNGTTSYSIIYWNAKGKRKFYVFSAPPTAKKEKKELLAELYQHAHEGFSSFILKPLANKMQEEVNQGKAISLQGAEVNSQGVKIKKGLLLFEDIEISFPVGTGSFVISSKNDEKKKQSFSLQKPESSQLLALLETIIPSEAGFYFSKK